MIGVDVICPVRDLNLNVCDLFCLFLHNKMEILHPNLESSSFRNVFHTFEWFIFFTVHI